MNSPFVFNVAELLQSNDALPEDRRQKGPSPSRIGPEMIAIAEGDPVTVEATITPLGSGVMIDAEVTAILSGECVRCLRPLHPEEHFRITQVFGADEDFVTGDDAEDADEEVPSVIDDTIDIEQAVIDEAGLNLPFNPTCPDGCDDENMPAPDGISGEEDEGRTDPRWAGLEKFL